MTINRDNYEEYLVSSLEGMLTTGEQALLDAFLYEHPELKQEVDAYKRAFLVPDKTITYPHKSLLLKPEPDRTATPVRGHNFVKINRINYEKYLVSSLEGKLTSEEQASLDAYLYEHPELKQEVDAYKLAFLVPDKTITYPYKSLLLKPEPVRRVIPFYRRYSVWFSVAATILLLIAFRVFLYNDNYGRRIINTPVVQSQASNQNNISSTKPALQETQAPKYIVSSGKSQANKIAGNLSNPVQTVNQQGSVPVNEVAVIPAGESTYLPQAQSKPRIASLPMTASEQALFVAQRQQAQRNQSALISNAALVGKTLWHLSGRQLPGETETGQQFHVVQVNYNSKDFSFVRIIH